MTIVPAAPVPLLSTLQLIANVKPDSFPVKIMWVAPSGIPMRSEAKANFGVAAKLPRVQKESGGAYVCMVRPWENSRKNLFPFDVKVAVDGEQSEERNGNFACRHSVLDRTSVSETPSAALFIQASCSHNSSKCLLQESIFKSLP